MRKYSRLKMQERRGANGASHRENEAEASNLRLTKLVVQFKAIDFQYSIFFYYKESAERIHRV